MRERVKGEKRVDADDKISDAFDGSLLLDRAGP